MKTFSLPIALLAAPAFADVLPREVSGCQGKAAGSACRTLDGQVGTCSKISITRPGVETLACVATAKGTARSLTPWVGLGLAFLALVAALKRRSPPSSLVA